MRSRRSVGPRLAALGLARLGLAVLGLVGATPAHADAAADKARAKAVAAAGVADYEAGRFEEALRKMREADALFDAPHHDVYAARALRKLGRWLEARAAYRAAIDAEADRPGFAEAKALALEELASLEKAMPALEVVVRGAELAAVRVDGRVVELDARGQVSVDPGARRVEIESREGRREVRRVRAAEGSLARLEIDLAPLGEAAPSSGGGPRHLVPAIAFGVGGAGIGVGIVTGVASLSRVSDLEAACPEQACPPALQGDVDAANTLANVSNVAFVVGAVGVAVGVVTLLLAGQEDEAEAQLGPGRGGGAWRTTF